MSKFDKMIDDFIKKNPKVTTVLSTTVILSMLGVGLAFGKTEKTGTTAVAIIQDEMANKNDNNKFSYNHVEKLHFSKLHNKVTGHDNYFIAQTKINNDKIEVVDYINNQYITSLDSNLNSEDNSVLEYVNLGEMREYIINYEKYQNEYTKEELESFLGTLVNDIEKENTKKLVK